MVFAFLFDGVGVCEWFVLLAVVLIVIGPKRLPSATRKFGNYYSKFRRAAESFKRQLMDMDLEIERAVQDAERQANEAFTIDEPAVSEASAAQSSEVSSDLAVPAEPVKDESDGH